MTLLQTVAGAPTHLEAVAETIRLAVAPVFLITGVASVLVVLTNRLARIVDRARATERELPTVPAERQQRLHGELAVLSRRSRLVNWAIILATVCALLVCTVIVLLFLGALMRFDVASAIAVLFIGAMLAFIGALVTFLREIELATSTLRFGPH